MSLIIEMTFDLPHVHIPISVLNKLNSNIKLSFIKLGWCKTIECNRSNDLTLLTIKFINPELSFKPFLARERICTLIHNWIERNYIDKISQHLGNILSS